MVLSSIEAESFALSIAASEASYIKKLLNEIGFEISQPVLLYYDNQSDLCLPRNPILQNGCKLIDIKYNYER